MEITLPLWDMFLRCSQCNSRFDHGNHEPKQLPCGHTVCATCTWGASVTPLACQNSYCMRVFTNPKCAYVMYRGRCSRQIGRYNRYGSAIRKYLKFVPTAKNYLSLEEPFDDNETNWCEAVGMKGCDDALIFPTRRDCLSGIVIQCPAFQWDESTVSGKSCLKPDGSLTVNPTTTYSDRHGTRGLGVCLASRALPSEGKILWQVVVQGDEYVFSFCLGRKDEILTILPHLCPSTFGIEINQDGVNIWNVTKEDGRKHLFPVTDEVGRSNKEELVLGFLLDADSKVLRVVHSATNSVMCTLNDVDLSQPLWPAVEFSLGHPNVKLFTGKGVHHAYHKNMNAFTGLTYPLDKLLGFD